MGDTGGANINPECRPNVIKYPDSKLDKQVKKTKFSPETEIKESKNSQTQQHTTYVPDTNLPLACLVCLCFNLPLGAVAMYLSLSAARLYRDGNVHKGKRRAHFSVLLSLFSIVTTVLIVMAVVLWIVVDDQNKRKLKQLHT